MYVCFFLGSVSFLFLSLCSVVHYAHDCSCIYVQCIHVLGLGSHIHVGAFGRVLEHASH